MRVRWAILVVLIQLWAVCAAAQRVAVFAPDRSEVGEQFAERLSEDLAARMKVVDPSLATSAFRSVAPESPFNLTTTDARRIGIAIGTDAFVLIRATTQRRSASGRADYYESYAAVFGVSSRTGSLFLWRLKSFEAATAAESRRMLEASVAPLAAEIQRAVKATVQEDLNAGTPPQFEEPPDERLPAAKTFRSPVPYRRLRPEYTAQAGLYEVAATIDLMVYLDAAGKIVRTDFERWGGFGLDEAVENNVRSMNWRPAERDGKALATKFLVRYNFKKIARDEKP
jgi:hypothetical protein